MYEKELNTAKKAALEAGKIIKEYFFGSFKIEEKEDTSIVTTADIESEKAIIKIIKENFPEHSIISEETGAMGKKSEFRWIIDPLDGTTNFSKKIPFFNVAIALEKNNEVIMGVVYQPITDELYYAVKGEGAFLNQKRIKTKENLFEKAYFGTCHGKGKEEKNKILKIMSILKIESKEIRKFGSADLELVYVASGRLDGFIAKGIKIMDFKPGCIILEEAGGKITDWDGNDWRKNKNGDILAASNEKIHKRLLNISISECSPT